MEARIVAVCDVYDALCSARPYKQPWAPQDALAYVTEQAGLHFDPRCVEAFVANIDTVREIRESLPDEEVEANDAPNF